MLHRVLFFLLLGALLVCLSAEAKAACSDSYCTAVLGESSLQSYWRLNESAGSFSLADEKGGIGGLMAGGVLGGNGIVVASTSLDLNSAPTSAVGFGDHYDFSGAVPFSFELWLKPTGTINPNTAIFGKLQLPPAAAPYGGWGLGTSSLGGNTLLGFGRYKADSSYCGVLAAMPSQGSWHHIVGVWNGSAAELWVDNAKSSLTNCDATYVVEDTAAQVGFGGGPFAVDEAAIYNSALSAAQINSHYQIVNPTPAPINTVAPKINGKLTVGSTNYCSAGTWTGVTSFTYRWLRDGEAISGQTTSEYILTVADQGHELSCEVTGNGAGGSVAVKTAAVAIPGGPGPSPTVTGLKFPKKTLSKTSYSKKLKKAKKACSKKPKKKRPACLKKAQKRLLPKASFTLSVPAKLTFTIQSGAQSVATASKSFKSAGKASFSFTPALMRKLAKGSYTLSLVASNNSGQSSEAAITAFNAS